MLIELCAYNLNIYLNEIHTLRDAYEPMALGINELEFFFELLFQIWKKSVLGPITPGTTLKGQTITRTIAKL